MTQIRYGQLAKYGESRGNVGNLLGDVPFGQFAQMLAAWRRGARSGPDRAGLRRARESVARAPQPVIKHLGRPREYAPAPKRRPCTSNHRAKEINQHE